LLDLREVTLLAQYTGSLIPEFMDNEGRQLYIETLINLEARRTGLFCAINEDALEKSILVGKNFNIYQDYQVLSHTTIAGLNNEYSQVISISDDGTDSKITVSGAFGINEIDGTYESVYYSWKSTYIR